MSADAGARAETGAGAATTRRFPAGFVWGAGTSAYQVEGGVHEDGRGESMWDRFAHTPGRVANDEHADVSSDHYHHVDEDIAILAELGLSAYRFSIAWPRIQPDGRGRLNQAGIGFYDRLIDRLLERGIKPCPTLYHWDLPQPLDDAGGWLSRATAERLAEYASACFEAYGDRVDTWFTINEPWVASVLGYRLGLHAPGHRDMRESVVASHHLLLAHGLAVEAFRHNGATGRIGIVLSQSPTFPATRTPEDAAAARGSDGYTNRWYLDPVLKGMYPDDMLRLWEDLVGPLPEIRPEDVATIGTPSDFLGVNYYARRVIGAGRSDDGLPWRVMPAAPAVPRTDTGWEITPDALFEHLVRVRSDYGDVPILITENGAVFFDAPNPEGRTFDVGRSAFLRDHLVAVHRAIEAGVPVEGYFAWSLLDNFEWAEGFRSRFGLVHVDYPSGRRLIKESGRWYAAVAAANAVEEPAPPTATPEGVSG
jgi:beta-glucosidase